MKTLRLAILGIGVIAALLIAACAPVAEPPSGPTQAIPTPQQITAVAPPAQPTGAAPSGESIKIGGGFALTGDESALDLPAANGAKLAAKEINAAGGINGKPIELIVHDSQYKMDVTAQICKQFVEQDQVVAVIGFTDTDSVLACGPVLKDAGLPFITAGATSPKIP